MSISQAVLGYGAKFFTGVVGVSTTTYTEVAEIASINFAGFTVAEVDVTNLASPNSMMESIPGLLKPGTVELTGNFIGDTTQQALTTLGQARTIFPWKIEATLGDAAVYTVEGNGFVSKLTKGPISADKKIDFTCGIQTTGAFTETVV
jgi:hypothetical protein